MHRDKDKENVDPLTYDEVLIVKVQSTCTFNVTITVRIVILTDLG